MGNESSTCRVPQNPNPPWSVLRAEIARLDQGEHEMDILCGDNEEYDIHQHMERCKKHPDHKDFIPVKKLTLNHIPAPWRHPDILAFIKHQCGRTVRLRVHYTSPDRPASLPYGNLKGTSMPRVGTGRVNPSGFSGSSQPCPLKDCSFSSAPHEVSSFFTIQTAAHVIFDNSEARKTVIEFFYDDEKDKSSIIKAEGIYTLRVSLDADISYITCVTHDPDWKQKLGYLTQVPHVNLHSTPNSPLAFIVSHPHGGSKQVTFGDLTHTEYLRTFSKEEGEVSEKFRKPQDPGKTFIEFPKNSSTLCTFKYNIPTCPGSSGAPMTTVQLSRLGHFTLCVAPHSRYKDAEKVNESGVGVFGPGDFMK